MSVAITIDFDYFVGRPRIDPRGIGKTIREKGFVLDQETKIARAEEHDQAYYWLEQKDIRLLVNFDRHFDFADYDEDGYEEPLQLTIGNWLRLLWAEEKYIVVPNKRKPRDIEPCVHIVNIKDLPRFNDLHVDYLFVCRSSDYIPYTYDHRLFDEMCSVLLKECNKESFDRL